MNKATDRSLFGYNGKMLIVDLSARTSHWESIADDVLKKFIGGTSLEVLPAGHRRP